MTATREGYVTYNREHTIQAGPMTLQISLTKIVVPAPAPTPTYTLSGLAIDLQGRPVEAATTYAYCCDSPVDGVLGRTFTDASGHFTLTLTTTRFPSRVRVEKPGYQRATATVPFFAPGTTASMTIVLARYIRYALVPISLGVGQTLPMTARLELDNGSSELPGAMNLSSNNPGVISTPDGRYIKGTASGTATITGSDEGLTGSIPLTVNP